MPNKKLDQLTNLSTLTDSDLLLVYDVDGGSEKTKNMTYAQFHTLISGTVGGGGGGNHNDLPDLQGADTDEFYHLNVHEEIQVVATQDDILTLGTADTKVTIDDTAGGWANEGQVTITASGNAVATFDGGLQTIGADGGKIGITVDNRLRGTVTVTQSGTARAEFDLILSPNGQIKDEQHQINLPNHIQTKHFNKRGKQ